MKCARCDWRPDREDERPDVEQLADHSLDAAHPLCTVCNHSLPPAEGAACDKCLTDTRTHLSGIILMFDELPTHLGHVRSAVYDSDRPAAADGQPLPGGDALVLLTHGSEGLSDNGETVRDGDPISVAFELGWWEQSWRETRHEPIHEPPRSAAATLRAAAGYLEVHARWAATSHPGFDDYATDLRRIHQALARATGRSERRIIAEADCFDCAGTLERLNTDDGYEDHWTCLRCGRQYTWQAYLLALRARLEAAS